MQLYLVQQGAAESGAEDPQRRLTAEGSRTVERMAKYLAALKLRISPRLVFVCCSCFEWGSGSEFDNL
jgi:phosphohistidine phosphatase SixA